MEWEKQRISNVVESLGFYGLVGVVRHILEAHYPQHMFGNSPDKGFRFTQKLHEALAILDESNANDGAAVPNQKPLSMEEELKEGDIVRVNWKEDEGGGAYSNKRHKRGIVHYDESGMYIETQINPEVRPNQITSLLRLPQ